jgi:predicted Zn-dependent protease
MRLETIRSGVLIGMLLFVGGCAMNPVTRQSQFMLISQNEEVQIGEKASKEVKQEYGYYDALPNLNAYVNTVGEKLVAQCQRRDIIYHFQVVDSPVINAFALPGGYIYVTRGILARMNSEDELAAVLGHELTHVAARHGAAQLSKAYAAQFGVAAISILNPNIAQSLGGLVDVSLQLALLGYSRGLEHQADEYGITYAERAGYNPRGAVKMFHMFETLQEKEPSRMERFLLSHPPTAQRLAYAEKRLVELDRTRPKLVNKPLKRDVFIEHIDGMRLGQRRGEKVLLGGEFYDKGHGAALTVPESYSADLNPKEGVATFVRLLKEPGTDQARRFVAGFEVHDLHLKRTADAFIKAYLKKIKTPVSVRKSEALRTKDGRPMAVRIVDLKVENGVLRAMMGFELRNKEAFVVYAYTDLASFGVAKGEFTAILQSLRFPSAQELAAVRPPSLKVVKAGRGDTWRAICRREFGKKHLASKLALYNGIFNADRQPDPGMLIKIPDVQSLADTGKG